MADIQPCPQCLSENPVTKRFCADCGSPLSSLNTTPDYAESAVKISPMAESFGWPQDEVTQVVPRMETAVSVPLPDLAGCPQCHSSQTQSFEMAYSVSTSSGTTAGGAYTFGVGPTIAAARTVQQSNLASYVQPPVRPTSTNGCAIAILAVVAASVLTGIVGSAFSAIAPDAQGGLTGIVWIASLVAIIVVAMKYENRRLKDRMETFNCSLDEWRRWWICLRCGHRWRR